MTAAELIEKLMALDPETPVLVDKEGCGCCEGYREGPAVLVRRATDGFIMVVTQEELDES